MIVLPILDDVLYAEAGAAFSWRWRPFVKGSRHIEEGDGTVVTNATALTRLADDLAVGNHARACSRGVSDRHYASAARRLCDVTTANVRVTGLSMENSSVSATKETGLFDASRQLFWLRQDTRIQHLTWHGVQGRKAMGLTGERRRCAVERQNAVSVARAGMHQKIAAVFGGRGRRGQWAVIDPNQPPACLRVRCLRRRDLPDTACEDRLGRSGAASGAQHGTGVVELQHLARGRRQMGALGQ